MRIKLVRRGVPTSRARLSVQEHNIVEPSLPVTIEQYRPIDVRTDSFPVVIAGEGVVEPCPAATIEILVPIITIWVGRCREGAPGGVWERQDTVRFMVIRKRVSGEDGGAVPYQRTPVTFARPQLGNRDVIPPFAGRICIQTISPTSPRGLL